jgi:hypothetical protein
MVKNPAIIILSIRPGSFLCFGRVSGNYGTARMEGANKLNEEEVYGIF